MRTPAPAMSHPSHRGLHIDPRARAARERDDHPFAGENRVGGGNEHAVRRKIDDAVGDQSKITLPHYLTAQPRGQARGAPTRARSTDDHALVSK